MNLAPHLTRIGHGTARAARAFWNDIEPKERAARLAAAAAVCWVAGGVALAEHRALWTMLTAWCITAWLAGRPNPADDEQNDEDEVIELTADGVTELVHALIGDAKGVLLTAVRDHLEQLAPAGWTTKDVRELLNDCEIPVRPGVRTPVGNGPGIHRQDVPPLPATPPPPDDVVAAGQNANTNTNNVRVESHAGGAHITVTPAREHA